MKKCSTMALVAEAILARAKARKRLVNIHALASEEHTEEAEVLDGHCEAQPADAARDGRPSLPLLSFAAEAPGVHSARGSPIEDQSNLVQISDLSDVPLFADGHLGAQSSKDTGCMESFSVDSIGAGYSMHNFSVYSMGSGRSREFSRHFHKPKASWDELLTVSVSQLTAEQEREACRKRFFFDLAGRTLPVTANMSLAESSDSEMVEDPLPIMQSQSFPPSTRKNHRLPALRTPRKHSKEYPVRSDSPALHTPRWSSNSASNTEDASKPEFLICNETRKTPSSLEQSRLGRVLL